MRYKSLCRPALPQRTPGVDLGRRELGGRANAGSQCEDDAPRRQGYSVGADLPGVATAPGARLERVWDEAEPGCEFVITRYRDGNANLRTQLERIIERAGLKPWPKLFQNLRATRATELANDFPAHVAAAWLGHSTVVATKHYWQATEDDFAKANQGDGQAAQKAAQQAHAGTRKAPQAANGANEKTLSLQGDATNCDTMQKAGSGRAKIRTSDLVLIRDAL